MTATATVHILRDVGTGLDPDRVATQILVAVDEAGVSIQVDPDEFRGALKAARSRFANLKFEPSKPHPALTRAIGNAKKGLRDDGVSLMWRRIGVDANGVLSYALIEQRTDAAGRTWDGEQRVTVSVEKTGSTLDVRWPTTHTLTDAEREEIDALRVRFAKERVMLTHSDVRDFINRVMLKELRGVRIGGTACFLLPPGDDEEALTITTALKLARVEVTPNEVMARGAHRFADAAKRDILDDVARLRAECEEKLAELRAGKKLRPESVGAKAAAVIELKNKITLYRTMLGFAVDDVEAALKAAHDAVATVLCDVTGGLVDMKGGL